MLIRFREESDDEGVGGALMDVENVIAPRFILFNRSKTITYKTQVSLAEEARPRKDVGATVHLFQQKQNNHINKNTGLLRRRSVADGRAAARRETDRHRLGRRPLESLEGRRRIRPAQTRRSKHRGSALWSAWRRKNKRKARQSVVAVTSCWASRFSNITSPSASHASLP